MGIVREIIEHQNLTEREQSIRTYLIQQPEKLYNMSARDLGEATYSSAAAVTRFCKKLGCRGYQDFRIRFLQDVKDMKGSVLDGDDQDQLRLNDIETSVPVREAMIYQRTIERTIRENPPERINRAFQMIRQADHLDFYAYDMNAVLANYAAYQFIRCGKAVSAHSEHFMQIRNAMEERPGHLAVIISYTGSNERLLELAGICRANGTKILCFTRNSDSPLSRLADYVLLLPAWDMSESGIEEDRETMFTTAFKYLVDILFAMEYSRDIRSDRRRGNTGIRAGMRELWQFDVGDGRYAGPDVYPETRDTES